MNKNTPRTRAFFFASLALLALILLSASLSSLEMSEGQPFSMRQVAPEVYDPDISSEGMRWITAFFRLLMIIGWVVLPIYIILLFVSKEERKRFLRSLIFWIPLLLFLFFLLNRRQDQNAEELSGGLIGGVTPGPAVTAVPPPEFVPPPQWVTTLATIVIALIITLILLGFFYMLWRQARNRQHLKEPLRMVEREARVALDAITAGGDLREAVLRCYVQMIEALKEYRGINREQDMTPHEFELILAKRGMPGEPVHQLTRLFEEVRYGTYKPGRKDEQTAISSLSAIISACQKVTERRG